MNRSKLLAWIDKVVGIAEHLPAKLKEPLLRELKPIQEVFLRARSARLVVVGDPNIEISDFLVALSGHEVRAGSTSNYWTLWTSSESAKIEIRDARYEGATSIKGLLHSDAIVMFYPTQELLANGSIQSQLETVAGYGEIPPILVLGTPDPVVMQDIQSLSPAFSKTSWTVIPWEHWEESREMLCSIVAGDARLEMARFASARGAQAEIAGLLLNSFSGMCGLIALQPIPLADMPFITTLQTLMVALIIYTSGRKFSRKLLLEFFAALGINVGAGFLFREGARAILKIIPVAGNIVAAGIAGAGTHVIGSAAIAYFIHGATKKEMKAIARRRSSDRPPLLESGENHANK